MSADTARLASQHHKLGKPGGPGLFHDKSLQLPAYIQNVAKALMRNGKSKSQAIQIAIGTVKNWAEGKGNVSPEVRAAAAKAVAEWEAAKAKARATPNKGANLSNPFVDLAAAEVTPTMGMVALEVPAGTLPALPGGTAPDDMHITLAFLGEDVDDRTFARAIAMAYDASHRRPLSGTVGGLGTFPPKTDGAKMPVWCPVNVPGVNDLASSFRSLSASTTAYVPHVTLAFMPEGSKLPAPVPETPVTLSNIIVKRGDQLFRFPLGEGYDDSPRESMFGRLRGKAIELANKAKGKPSSKPAKGDQQSAKYGEPALPKGATHWKHGWVPVDDSGKPVGPAQKPAWLIADEKKHAAAGGKTAAEYRAEAAQKEMAAPAKRAAAKKKAAERKAAAAKKHAEVQARVAANKKKAAAAKAEREHTAAQKKAASAAKAKETARQKQINAAYKQAQADLKAGRKLSPQQERVVAYVNAQNAKTEAANRKVDVPGQKVKAASKPATPAAKAAKAQASTSAARKTPKVRARSYKSSSSHATALANEVWDVVDLSAANPKGHLAFRYKHNWILINPAIPSRGRMGGGLAKKYGVASGTVTHGHFEDHPTQPGKKIFVADRQGGVNSPAKLKAAHSKDMTTAKPDKSKYTLAANKQAAQGDALKPATPTAAQADAKSKAAHEASTAAQKSGTVQDAQVAAKKHADAFVAHKKVGNDAKAQMHKNVAQGWAKKAGQLKQAEKATAEAKKKHDAEQKAKADTEAAKLKAEEAAKAKKKAAQMKALDLMSEAEKLEKLALGMNANSAPGLQAKSNQYKYAHNKWQEAADHLKANGMPVGPQLKKKLESTKFNQEQFAKEAEQVKKDANKANAMGADAFDASEVADEKGTAAAHKAAAADHAAAAKQFDKVFQYGDAKMHAEKAKEHQAKAAELESAASGKGVSPGIAKTNAKMEKSKAIGEVIDGLGDEVDGSLAKWDDYLHAAYDAKVNSTPENLKKLKAATTALQADGATLPDIKDATSNLFAKAGFTKATKKAAVPPVKTAKKAATPPAKAPETTPAQVDPKDWEVKLPGPGMFNDGNAVMGLMNKPATSPEEEKVKAAATEKALAEFEKKHGKKFDPNAVEVDLFESLNSGGPAVPQLADDFFDAAKAAGYHHPATGQDMTNGWKPPAHTKSALLGYTSSDPYVGYGPINGQLRKGEVSDKIAQRVKLMDEAFDDAPGLAQDTVTIRKMSSNGQFPAYPPPMTEGDEYIDYGYGSTSKSLSGWSGHVIMEVRAKKGTKAIDVNHNKVVSCSTSEQELLFPRGAKYRVISDTKVGGQRRIVTEIVSTGHTHPNAKL